MSDSRPMLDYAKPPRPRPPAAVRVAFGVIAIGLCGMGALLCGVGLVMSLILVGEFSRKALATMFALLLAGAAVWWAGCRFDARSGSIRLR